MSLHSSPNSAACSTIYACTFSARRTLPQNHVLLPQQCWKSKSCDMRRLTSNPAITFDFIGAPTGLGIPVLEVTARGDGVAFARVLVGGQDRVLVGQDKIMFRVMWPGYEGISWNRSIPINGGITRGQLAFQISKLIVHFMETMSREAVSPDQRQWKIGRGGVGAEYVQLVSLYNSNANCFQAEIHLKRC
ncbi:hypothetical protein C8Q75DRAFT_413153 [Abortiporus biennis]|nr:hypothetical protein C8Q75DRAFT_413153 [Abortiporus biennis]